MHIDDDSRQCYIMPGCFDWQETYIFREERECVLYQLPITPNHMFSKVHPQNTPRYSYKSETDRFSNCHLRSQAVPKLV